MTRTFLREAEAVAFARARIASGSDVSADEGPHWDLLDADFELRRITHAEAYSRNGAQPRSASLLMDVARRYPAP